MTIGEMASLSCYWLGWATLWMPLMVVIIPKQVGLLCFEYNCHDALSSDRNDCRS